MTIRVEQIGAAAASCSLLSRAEGLVTLLSKFTFAFVSAQNKNRDRMWMGEQR
jgi:hypothetical protein